MMSHRTGGNVTYSGACVDSLIKIADYFHLTYTLIRYFKNKKLYLECLFLKDLCMCQSTLPRLKSMDLGYLLLASFKTTWVMNYHNNGRPNECNERIIFHFSFIINEQQIDYSPYPFSCILEMFDLVDLTFPMGVNNFILMQQFPKEESRLSAPIKPFNYDV